MLVLTRRAGESIQIGDSIRVTLVHVQGRQVRLAIEAPRNVAIRRSELGEAVGARVASDSARDASDGTAPEPFQDPLPAGSLLELAVG